MLIGNSTLANICIQKGANIIRLHDIDVLSSVRYANKIYRDIKD